MMELTEYQVELLNDFMKSSIRSSKKYQDEYKELCPSLHQYFSGMRKGTEEIYKLFNNFVEINI